MRGMAVIEILDKVTLSLDSKNYAIGIFVELSIPFDHWITVF
jgi:hypothetical protein